MAAAVRRGGMPRTLHEDSMEYMDDMEDQEGMEPDMANTNHMAFVDGRCSCCPYGYHVDLDFLRFCDSPNDVNYLSNLKKIRQNKRKLRKSMEIFINQQEKAAHGEYELTAPPPDVVHSTENFMNLVEYEETTTNQVLEQIDTSVNATIDLLRSHNKRIMNKSSDSYDTEDDIEGVEVSPGPGGQVHLILPPPPPDPRSRTEMERRLITEMEERFQYDQEARYRTEAELLLHGAPPPPPLPPQQRLTLGKSDSISSLSSQSTFSSEQPTSLYSSGSNNPRYTTHMYITSQSMYGQMESLFPEGQVNGTGSIQTDSTTITRDQLNKIRENFHASLQRMRELEEQVKNIPVLQVRISVLKEEKRLLMLQLKAKNNKLNMRTIGVSEDTVDGFDVPDFTTNFNGEMIPPKPDMRSIGVGDGNVFESALQVMNGAPEVRERELHTEQSTHVLEKEKEIHTLLLGQDAERMNSLMARRTRSERSTPTRSIGVGEGDVFDPSNSVHVHEKEMRTVIIGGEEREKKTTRNVGVNCKAPMRDVGVMYHYEHEKPMTRTIAVGVSEGGILDSELFDMAPITTVHTSHTSLQQMNLAAFHSRNIHIRQEDLRLILDEKLRKLVRSVGCQVRFATQEKGVNHVGYEMTSVGCGSDSVDVDIRPVVATRTVGIDHRPNMLHRSTTTEKMHTKDAGTMMRREIGATKGVNTDKVVCYQASTNTENIRTQVMGTETDFKIFQALDMIKNTGVNTTKVPMINISTNTMQDDTPKKRTHDQSVSTANLIQHHNRGVNTEMARKISTGVGDFSIKEHVDCDICLVKPKSKSASVETVKSSTSSMTTTGESKVVEELLFPSESSSSTLSREVEITRSMKSPVISGGSTLTREVEMTSASRSRDGPVRTAGGTTIVREIDLRESRGVPASTSNQEVVIEASTTRKSIQRGADYELADDNTEERYLPFGIGKQMVTRRFNTTHTTDPTLIRESEISTSSTSSSSKSRSLPGREVEISSSTTSSSSHSRPQVVREVQMSSSTSSSTRPQVVREVQMSSSTSSSTRPQVVREVQMSSSTSSSTKPQVVREVEISSSSSASNQSKPRTPPSPRSNKVSRTIELFKEKSQPAADRAKVTREIMLTGKAGSSSSSEGGSSSTSRTVRSEVVSHSGASSTVSHLESTGSEGGNTVAFESSPGGGTQMRVVRRVETTYVGGQPVKQSSDVVFKDKDGVEVSSADTTSDKQRSENILDINQSSKSGSASNKTVTKSVTRKSYGSKAIDDLSSKTLTKEVSYPTRGGKEVQTTTTTTEEQPSRLKGRTVTVTETRIERHATGDTLGGALKSIMKQPGSSESSATSSTSSEKAVTTTTSSSATSAKKEIKFAEGTVGGYVSSSSGEESDAESDHSSGSFDEGSYDGRLGKIVYQCKDDEAIAQGAPGAKIFELSREMQDSCGTYARWLEDSTNIASKELNAALNVVQQDWFKVSSHKLSNPSEVEDYLSCFNEISRDLLINVVNMSDTNGNTGLHYAVSHCNMEIVNLLLDTGAMDVNKQNKAGYTAIMLASLAQIQTDRQRDIVRRLFSMGDVNARASQAGQTALMLAVSHGRNDMVKMLLEATAEVNLQDDDGSTALMCACEHGHTDIVKMLLAHADCDPTITDNDGSTAMSIAMEAGHRDVGVLLYAHVNFKQGSPVLARAKLKRMSSSSSPTSPRMLPYFGQSGHQGLRFHQSHQGFSADNVAVSKGRRGSNPGLSATENIQYTTGAQGRRGSSPGLSITENTQHSRPRVRHGSSPGLSITEDSNGKLKQGGKEGTQKEAVNKALSAAGKRHPLVYSSPSLTAAESADYIHEQIKILTQLKNRKKDNVTNINSRDKNAKAISKQYIMKTNSKEYVTNKEYLDSKKNNNL